MPPSCPRRLAGAAPETYLQVPPGLDLLRMTARRVTDSLGEGRNLRASRLVHFLTHNGFSYKLDPFVPVQGKDPVEHFLETARATAPSSPPRSRSSAAPAASRQRRDRVPAPRPRGGRLLPRAQLRRPRLGRGLVRPRARLARLRRHARRDPDLPSTPEGAPVASVEDKKKEDKGRPSGGTTSSPTSTDATQSLALGEGLRKVARIGAAAGSRFPLTAPACSSACRRLAIAYPSCPAAEERLRQSSRASASRPPSTSTATSSGRCRSRAPEASRAHGARVRRAGPRRDPGRRHRLHHGEVLRGALPRDAAAAGRAPPHRRDPRAADLGRTRSAYGPTCTSRRGRPSATP
jgi:hypothetical protein